MEGLSGVFLLIVKHIVTSSGYKEQRAPVRHIGTAYFRAFVERLHVHRRGFLVLRQGVGGADRYPFSISTESHANLFALPLDS